MNTLTFVAGMMQGVGLSLEAQDTNTTGKDDLIGLLLVSGGDALTGFASNNDTKLRKAITAIRDGADAYLKATSPTQ
jgi:hypothetical protein